MSDSAPQTDCGAGVSSDWKSEWKSEGRHFFGEGGRKEGREANRAPTAVLFYVRSSQKADWTGSPNGQSESSISSQDVLRGVVQCFSAIVTLLGNGKSVAISDLLQ